MVRYLKDLTLNSIPQVHVSKEYPINYGPLNFTDIGKIFLVGVKGIFVIRAVRNSCMKVISLPSVTFNRQSKVFGIRTEVLMDSGLSRNPWSLDSCMES